MGDSRVDDAPGRPRRRGARVDICVSGSSTKARPQRCSTARPASCGAPRRAQRRQSVAWQDVVQRSRGVELWSIAGGALWWSSPRLLCQRARRASGASRARRRRADRPSRAERAEILISRNIYSQDVYPSQWATHQQSRNILIYILNCL